MVTFKVLISPSVFRPNCIALFRLQKQHIFVLYHLIKRVYSKKLCICPQEDDEWYQNKFEFTSSIAYSEVKVLRVSRVTNFANLDIPTEDLWYFLILDLILNDDLHHPFWKKSSKRISKCNKSGFWSHLFY